MNSIAIFSDLHLSARPSARNRAFENLLKSWRGPRAGSATLAELNTGSATLAELNTGSATLAELWLLGDIFDLLIGPYEFWNDTHRAIFAELERLAREGVQVLWIEGNHDFHIGALLEPRGIRLEHGAVVRKVNGRRIYLAHGDLVNGADHAYLRWHAFVRSPLFRFVMHSIPGTLADRFLVPLGERLSHESRSRDRYDPKLRDLYVNFARARWREGFDGVCLGHCHIPEQLLEDGRFYFNMGSWIGGEYRYGWWDADREPLPEFKIVPNII